jgi:hypothetical protein
MRIEAEIAKIAQIIEPEVGVTHTNLNEIEGR